MTSDPPHNEHAIDDLYRGPREGFIQSRNTLSRAQSTVTEADATRTRTQARVDAARAEFKTASITLERLD